MLIGIGGRRRGERILLWRERITVGRDPGSLVLPPDATVSRRHAEFSKVDDISEVADLESLNGTHVYDQLVQVAPLGDGDQSHFGGNLFLSYAVRTDQARNAGRRRATRGMGGLGEQ